MWFSTIASMGANAKVIAPDLPGFGRMPLAASRAPSLDYIAEWLAAVLDEHGYSRAVVAGMSMGGYIALAFAANFRERVAGLGLISSQTVADSEETRRARRDTIQKIKSQGPSVAAELLLPKMFAGATPQNPELARYPKEGAERAGVDGLCWALEAMARRPDRTAMLKELEVPVLVLHGTEDKIIPPTKARLLAESCRKPILMELNGVGHASPLEAPDQVATGLTRLVRQSRGSDGNDRPEH
jgi:pimeloyl-ACP methyl ester carboxylesterase